jgi:hypothetical protein
VAGTVAAHAVDYRVLFPAVAMRGHHLAATGHSYWPAAVGLAIVGAMVAGLAAVSRGGSTALRGLKAGAGDSLARRLLVLAAGQTTLFLAVEVAERVAIGSSPIVLLRSPELSAGIVLQLLVAAVVLPVLTAIERITNAAVARLAGRRRRRVHLKARLSPSRPSLASASVSFHRARPRGPPSRRACSRPPIAGAQSTNERGTYARHQAVGGVGRGGCRPRLGRGSRRLRPRHPAPHRAVTADNRQTAAHRGEAALLGGGGSHLRGRTRL